MSNDIIKIGDYIVIQKQNYKKLIKFKPNSNVSLGRDTVSLSGLAGCPYYSIFKMISNSKKGREFRLELANEVVELKDEIEIKASGTDNRNIIDDGRSQKLTYSEIEELSYDANKASDIVETLISNSKTFHDKTEFSQEKYLKKKEKKYFEYVQILKPNLRIIAEIMLKLEPVKIQFMRIDTLSQIITMSNIHCEGNYLLYDSGSNGLNAAALLSAIGSNTNGKLIHMHPGNLSQKQALLAMNFSEEQYKRCISVNIYSVLRQYYQGNTFHIKDKAPKDNVSEHKDEKNSDCVDSIDRLQKDGKPNISTENNTSEINSDNTNLSEVKKIEDLNSGTSLEMNNLKRKAEDENEHNIISKVPKTENEENPCDDNGQNINKVPKQENIDKTPIDDNGQNINKVPKQENIEENPIDDSEHNTVSNVPNQGNIEEKPAGSKNNVFSNEKQKTPQWYHCNIAASDILKDKVDALVITCKEDPENIFLELLQFIKPCRPFVIYNPVAEPLQSLYMTLKTHPRLLALKLTCSWLRNYQVLPERTHPEVTMNGQSGFLLTGYVVK